MRSLKTKQMIPNSASGTVNNDTKGIAIILTRGDNHEILPRNTNNGNDIKQSNAIWAVIALFFLKLVSLETQG